MPVDLNYVVALLAIVASVLGVGWRLGQIALGILDKISSLATKVEVVLATLMSQRERMDRQDERINKLEARIERLESKQGEP